MVASNRVRNKSTGSSCSGYMRVDLYISCVLIFFFQIIRIACVSIFDTLTESKLAGTGFIYYATQVFIAVMALIAIQGAHSKDSKSLKVFSYPMFILSLVILILALKAVTSTDLNQKDDEFHETMQEFAKGYMFDMRSSDEHNGGTQFWDAIQEGSRCCGWDNFRDWQKWKPEYFNTNTRLPRSCCSKYSLDVCTTMSPNIHPSGCGLSLEATMHFFKYLSILEGFLYMELATFAYLLAKYWEIPDHADGAPVDAEEGQTRPIGHTCQA